MSISPSIQLALDQLSSLTKELAQLEFVVGKEKMKMTGRIIGFVIWSVVGCLFIGLGIYSFFAKKPMGFWANAQMFEVTDRKKYNAAVRKLFSVFGIGFILLGLPLLAGQNSPWIFLSVLGALLECIAAMVVYTVVIEERYRKK